jgi:hypothetical protein
MSYQLQRNVVASWPIKFIKGARHGLKRPEYSSRENKHFKSDIAGKFKKSKFKTGKRF